MDEKILVEQHDLQSSFKRVIMTKQQYLHPRMPSLDVPQVDSHSCFAAFPSASPIILPSLTSTHFSCRHHS